MTVSFRTTAVTQALAAKEIDDATAGKIDEALKLKVRYRRSPQPSPANVELMARQEAAHEALDPVAQSVLNRAYGEVMSKGSRAMDAFARAAAAPPPPPPRNIPAAAPGAQDGKSIRGAAERIALRAEAEIEQAPRRGLGFLRTLFGRS